MLSQHFLVINLDNRDSKSSLKKFKLIIKKFSVRIWRNSFFFLFISLLLFIVVGCKKPEDLGLGVLPASDPVRTPYCDTSTILTVTTLEDSLRSDELSRILLGSYNEPDFGLSEASIYTQILLGTTPNLQTNKDSALTADSVVLSLAYAGYYGDSASLQTQQTVHVYRLLSDMYYDSTYYTSTTFQYDNTTDLANSFQFLPKPADSVLVDAIKQPSQLRIPLIKSFADSLISFRDSFIFINNDKWKEYFKGVYIKVDPAVPGSGAILYFDPLSAYTRMTLYYHEGTTKKSYDFALNGARVNHQSHNYIGSSVANVLPDSSNFNNNDSLMYLQSMAGLKVKIKFPYIKHFVDSGNIIINKAELIIKAPSNSMSRFAAPVSILLSAFDSTGAIKYIPDFYESNFGGTIDPLSTTATYKFNIARQLQQIIDGKITDYGFSLNVLSSCVQGDRVIIGSNNSISSKMKLRLFYTKLPAMKKPDNKPHEKKQPQTFPD